MEKHFIVEAQVLFPLPGLENSFSPLLLGTLGVFYSLSLSMATKLLPEGLLCVTGLSSLWQERKEKKLSPPFKALIRSLKSVFFSGCFW